MNRVFVSSELPGDAVSRLSRAADVTVGEGTEGVRGARFEAMCSEAVALVALLTDRVDAALLARLPKLRIVANVAVGTDNIDLEACRARGVIVTNTPGVLTEATADLALGLLLAAARRIAEGDRMVRAGEWTGWTPTMLLGARVHGMTLGILGLGRIGRAVARRARGFGMHLLYSQRSRLLPEMERALGAAYVPLEVLFEESDAITIHCPLSGDTRKLVSAARLAKMKRGSVLVNTARGPIVDEAALAHALEVGPIGAAGLDVFEDEPRVHPALLARPNVVLAPHIGSADRETRESMASIAVDNVLAVLGGHAPINAVG
jgi:glyoxylate reductase